jgi:uncharacterized delta-60 repeat protein
LLCLAFALAAAQAQAVQGGLPDPGFGTEGIAGVSTAPEGERESGNAMVVDPLGRVLVGGSVQNNTPGDSNGGWILVRFRTDGSLDTGFGEGGFARAPGLFGPDLGNFGEEIRALALVPGSDKILAGGMTLGASKKGEFTVARYNGDGTLDMTFGPADTGFVQADVSPDSDQLADIAVSPSGAITAVGHALSDSALARWDSDGVPDPSFDGPGVPGNGMFVDPVAVEQDDYREVEVEPSGAVRAVGLASIAKEGNWLVTRYTPTGARDLGFGGAGVVTTDFAGQSDLGAAQALVGGTLYVFGSIDEEPGPKTERDFAVVALDAATGVQIAGTRAQIPLPGTQNMFAAAVQHLDGVPGPAGERFLLAGTGGFGGGSAALLMRMRRVGGTSTALEPDPEFGAGGVLPPPGLNGGNWADVAVDAQGRVVAGGEVGVFETADFSAARFLEQAPAAAADTTAPAITRLRITPREWAVARRGRAGARLARRRLRHGTTIRFRLSEAARVVVRIERRRVRKKRRFTRAGRFAIDGRAGGNHRRFGGRIGKRKLRPGRYRATLVATDPAGNRSKPKRAAFRVVRRPARR